MKEIFDTRRQARLDVVDDELAARRVPALNRIKGNAGRYEIRPWPPETPLTPELAM